MAAGLRKAGHVSILLSWISALAAGPLTSAADADHSSYLTFSQQVALPGVSLGARTCIFEVPESNTSWDVVRVSKRGY
jgi:hypothetical protein